MADTYNYGWNVMQEYTANILTEDSDADKTFFAPRREQNVR